MSIGSISILEHQVEYKKSLLIVLYIHVAMFFIIAAAGLTAKSSAVIADSMDFIGDAANYAVSLYVLDKSRRCRAWAAVLKAMCMLLGGVPICIYAATRYETGLLPNHELMSASGFCAIIAHAVCIYYLYQFRKGDSNLLSVWICTINDLISNLLIILASIAVMLTYSIIPDILAAILIVGIAFFGACTILKRAINEIRNE